MPPGTDPTTYVLSVEQGDGLDVPIGTERRWATATDEGWTVVRRRTTFLRLGGERKAIHGASEVRGPPDGPATRYVRWSPTNQETWTGSAWIPDVAPPPTSGRWPIVDPFSLEVVSGTVTLDDGPPRTVTWTGPGGVTRATFDEAGLVHATQGVFTLRRGPAPALLENFDPVALYAIPTAAHPRAERSLVGRFVVDGVPVRIDAPIWEQIPAVPLPPHPPSETDALVADAPDARRAVQQLVLHVHTSLDGQPQPGTRDAVTALREGRGDCDEAAAAFVALAQSIGLEAELVGGLVYRRGVVGPGLYPHAWASVRVAGTSVAVDPALGQAPADASHVPLGTSAAEAAARLSRGVQIAVVELR